MINIVHSGVIGEIKDVDATFTKLITDKKLREFNKTLGGGSLNELGSYPLFLITKILGVEPEDIQYYSFFDKETNVDLMTKVVLKYKNAVATANVGIGVKKEGNCVISGTKGYVYIPAPWWKTEYFEVRFEDLNSTQKVFEKFNEDGLRYEIAEFIKSISTKVPCYKFTCEESIFISSILDNFNKGVNVNKIN